MKAERRHELQTNTLAHTLENLPLLLRVHANKILLVLVFIALLVFLIRYRTAAAREQATMVRQSLATVRSALGELERLEMTRAPEQVAASRRQMLIDINGTIDSILQDAGDDEPAIRAEALLARGDLYWHLANAAPLPGAATQESLRLPQPPEELLKRAEESYRRVAEVYPNQVPSRVAAQFGLAAVAENRRDWDAAQKLYQQIVDASDVPDLYKNPARERLSSLAQVREPVLIGPLNVDVDTVPPLLAAPTTGASTRATTGPATTPAAGPTTTPATAPTTAPTQPAH